MKNIDQENLRKLSIRGVFALISRTVFLQGVNLVSYFVLTILLGPAETGVYLVVSAIRDIFSLFSDLGFGGALVQKPDEPTASELTSTFFIQEFILILVVIIGLALSSLIQVRLKLDSSGILLYRVVILTLVINSFKTIPSILLERKLAFERQIIPQIIETLVFNVLVIFWAWRGIGISAYTVAVPVSAALGLLGYYFVSPWWPTREFSFRRLGRLFSYGIQLQAKSYLGVAKDQLLTVTLAGLVGPAGIGYWGWAQRYAYSPFRLVVDSVTKVTFPAYSRVQHSVILLRTAIERSLFAVSMVLFPILTMMVVFFPKIILLIPRYGRWEPAIVSFYFLCATAAISALSGILINVLDATGRVRTTLVLMVLWLAMSWVLTIKLVAAYGFTGISVASFGVALTIFLTVYLVKRVIPFSFLPAIYRQILASFIMGAVGWWLLQHLPPGYLSLTLSALTAALVYFVLMLLSAGREIKQDLRVVWQAYRQ